MTATKSTTLAARLAAIMGDVGRIEKKGRITSQGGGPNYKFARDSDVLEAVTPKMAEAGIIMVPAEQQLLSLEPNQRGTQIIANIRTTWRVTDGTESIEFQTFGQGQDSGDKALPKAQSNARKYAFFMLYHIVTGDDPDQHASEDGSPRGRPIQQSGRSDARVPTGRAEPPEAAASASTEYTNRGQIQQAIVEAAKERGLGISGIDALAKELGIKRGEATMEQLLVLLVAIERGNPEQEDLELVS